MKIVFECIDDTCENKISINTAHIEKVTQISCPCCGNTLPQKSWDEFKKRILELEELMPTLNVDNTNFYFVLEFDNNDY